MRIILLKVSIVTEEINVFLLENQQSFDSKKISKRVSNQF